MKKGQIDGTTSPESSEGTVGLDNLDEEGDECFRRRGGGTG